MLPLGFCAVRCAGSSPVNRTSGEPPKICSHPVFIGGARFFRATDVHISEYHYHDYSGFFVVISSGTHLRLFRISDQTPLV